ncbi:unnamed protein product [Anisakis simplex]|uniref:5'-3' exoribonuclease 1 (inferred by orthology to a human protein) n=1 Tax=Anisakis simplex TaxID=6269 RepID=A0A0M3J5G1_ANISI|nr:unnamed protein product [Anisakis simplex]
MDDENYLASKRNETSMAMGGGGGSSSRGVDGHKSKSIRKKTPNGDDEEEDLELHPYSDSDMEMDEEETAAGAGEIALKGQSKAKGAFDSDSEGDDGSSDEAKSREAETKFELPSACELLSDGLPPSDEDNFAMGVLDEDDYENDFEIAWTHTVNRAFKNHKRDYYTDKLKYENISKEELREQAEGYIRALQWNLHYYYHGCCSWNW